MTGSDDAGTSGLHDRIADQFSYRGRHADIWRALDRVLSTDRYLNLGYSPRLVPTLLGSSQRRLAAHVAGLLDAELPGTSGVPLLDVGCGRGGPATLLGARGFVVTGIDLVPYNVREARTNAARDGVPAGFVVGDASRLPFTAAAFGACTAVDAIVYMPAKRAVFAELARVLRNDGVVVVTDLVARDDADSTLTAFAAAWDMPTPPSLEDYRAAIDAAGLAVRSIEDLSRHSIDRYRRWARLYLGLHRVMGPALDRGLARLDLDADAVTQQIRAAARAIPSLAHVAVVAAPRE